LRVSRNYSAETAASRQKLRVLRNYSAETAASRQKLRVLRNYSAETKLSQQQLCERGGGSSAWGQPVAEGRRAPLEGGSEKWSRPKPPL
jgi:hypothetical protein